jgi:hypothetical protein
MSHAHGRIQRFLCRIGLHPSCCSVNSGLLFFEQRCLSCGAKEAGR